jgi:hypothetical protein
LWFKKGLSCFEIYWLLLALVTGTLGFLVIYACNLLGKTQSHKSNPKEWHSAKFSPRIGGKEKSKGRLRLPILKIINFKW